MKKHLVVAALALPLLGCPFQRNSCVAAGSRVFTPDGWIPVENLGIGDLVYAVHESTGELVKTEVVATQSATREVGLVSVAGVELRMTSDHPVYCPREKRYVPAGDWFLGKRTALAMVTDDGLTERIVENVDAYVGVSEVFDITVEHELHNFIVEGIVVHNKSPVEDYDCRIDGYGMYDGSSCPCGDDEWIGTANCNLDNDELPVCVCPDDSDMGGAADTGGTADVGSQTDMGAGASDMGAASDAGMTDMGADAGTDAGMLRMRGTCTSDADCATGTCVAIPAGADDGYFTCQQPKGDAPNCATPGPTDDCCVHEDCTRGTNGTCVAGPIFYCGGVAPIPANVCMADECANEADCSDEQVCVPAGTFGEPVARCAPAQCEADSDCVASTGGECRPFTDPCNNRFSGFFCTYDDSECRSNADCRDGVAPYCQPGQEDGETSCQQFFPPP